jgi:hypothetical protein
MVIGDVVHLNSNNSVLMTVTVVRDKDVDCVYFDGGVLRLINLPPQALTVRVYIAGLQKVKE